MHEIRITNAQNIPFIVRRIEVGAEYARGLIASRALIEFWDARRPDRPAQFVQRYYAVTLAESGSDRGLLLDTGSPDWQVTAQNMDSVRALLISSADPWVQITCNGVDMGHVPAQHNHANRFIFADACYSLLSEFDDAHPDNGELYPQCEGLILEALNAGKADGSFTLGGFAIQWHVTCEPSESASTVRDVVDTVWHALLMPEVLAMPAYAGCAIDCLRIIRAAETLLAQCADLRILEGGRHAANIRAAVAFQCRVFYTG